MSSGHGVDKPNKAEHPSRQVHRGRFVMGEGFGGVNAEYEAMHDYDEPAGPRHPADEEAERQHEAGDWRY
jgi:hypothetical protein